MTGYQKSWPPGPPQQGRGIYYSGFPGRETVWLSPREISFGAAPGGGIASSVSEIDVSTLIEQQHLIAVMGGGTPPENYDFRGMSGGPMLTVVETETNRSWSFTLNQDIFFERYLFNEHVAGAPAGALPGPILSLGQNWFRTNVGPYSPFFVMQPAADPRAHGQLQNQMNVIKLHGSFNWRSRDGGNVMVIGTEKTARIAERPLLSWYTDIFKQVLNARDVRLMIVGYGFGDEHINAGIAEAIEKHGLSVFIWNTSSDLKALVTSAPHGATIWRGLISTATRRLIEVFPSNQAER